MQHHRLTPLSLLLAVSCATGTTAPPKAGAPLRGCDDVQIVARAAEALGEGRLLRARGILKGQRPDDPRCVDPGRAELEATVDRELGDPATIDPFAAIDAARAAADPIAAQKSWDRAANALEVQTGKQGRPLWFQDKPHRDEPINSVTPIPTSPARDVVYGRRRADGPLEPIRIAEDAIRIAGGEILTMSGGTVRRVVPEAIFDPTIEGVGTLAFSSSNTSPRAVACDRSGLHVYDTRSHAIVGHAARPCPNRMMVASAERLVTIGETVAVLELPSLRTLAELPGSDFIDTYTLSTDRSTFAAIEDLHDEHAKILLLDVQHGATLGILPHPKVDQLKIALSPNGKKLLVVEETAEVFDLPSQRRSPLGGRVFHPFRPGSYGRDGWTDLVTPPAGTGAIAVLDDGRACIEQGGTAAILPRSATEVCSLDKAGAASLGRIAATSTPSEWSPPPRLTDDSNRTLLVSEPAELVLRVEHTRDKVAKTVIVAYDPRSGRERRRFPLELTGSVSLEGLDADGRALDLRAGGSTQEDGTSLRLDLESGALTSTLPANQPPASWVQTTIEGGKLIVHEQPSELHWFWDLRDLRRFGLDEPSFGAIPPVPALTLVVTPYEGIQVFDKRAGSEPIATMAPMRRGLAVFWQSGELELASISDVPQDLVCTYGDLVVPLQACGERIVQGSWRRRFGG